MKFNLSEIMTRAWRIFRKNQITFSEALHRAWQAAKAQPVNAQRIAEAQAAAGIDEECKTWAGWREAGYMVKHGSKALFKAVLLHSSKGDNAVYTASFFAASQTEPITA